MKLIILPTQQSLMNLKDIQMKKLLNSVEAQLMVKNFKSFTLVRGKVIINPNLKLIWQLLILLFTVRKIEIKLLEYFELAGLGKDLKPIVQITLTD